MAIWPGTKDLGEIMAFDDGWAFCNKCAALFFNREDNKGVCPKDGGGHNGDPTLPYVVRFGQPTANRIKGFAFCIKCRSLYLQDSQPDIITGHTLGVCPTDGGRHATEPSLAYLLDRDRDQAHGQGQWVVCENCNCVVHGPESDRACAAAGDAVIGHNPGSNPLLLMRFEGD